MQFLFYNTKEAFHEDQLFEDNEIIKIRQNSFEQILEKLQVYNLSDTQDDVKGIAFEQFLGTTFRGELGQYFTPRTIVNFMTAILDPKEGEVICDPTCGSGGSGGVRLSGLILQLALIPTCGKRISILIVPTRLITIKT